MGMSCMSSSSYDGGSVNPNPKKYKIMDYEKNSSFLILWIKYLNCTNYEGNKILVYKDVTIEEIKEQGRLDGIDPHFSNNKKYHSPVARFEPTEFGLELAQKMCQR